MIDAAPTTTSRPAPLGAVLVLTALCSLGTGIFWHGTAFIAKHTYGFDETATLLLYVAMGAVYTAGAFGSGRVIRRAERWLSTRAVLAVSLVASSALCLLPVIAGGSSWGLWVAVVSVTWFTSIGWPIIESYLASGRHGAEMRHAIGWFNLTWAPFVAVPLYMMAPLVEEHGTWAIAGLSVALLTGLPVLPLLGSRPAHHDPDTAAGHVGAEYPMLLRSARVLLPLSYVVSMAMNPILPYRFAELDVAVGWQTPAAATYLVLRFATFLVMWRLAFWHGRWGTLLLGAVMLTGGFALVAAAGSFAAVAAGLGCVGVGLGVIYYAALYYAMAVGHGGVDAGGTHEGLIGAGYGVGPLAGLAGRLLETRLALAGGVGVVTVVWALVAAAGVPAVVPYLKARRARARDRKTEN